MATIEYKITPSDTVGVGIEEFQPADLSLVNRFKINSALEPQDYVELHIYSLNGERLQSIYNYTQYKALQDSSTGADQNLSTLYIDPQQDIISYGFSQGDVKLLYHFLKLLSTGVFFISEISNDRTELRVKTNGVFPVDELNQLLQSFQSTAYFPEFRLNFSNNELIIGVNLRIEGEDLFIKLYEPLPSSFQEKSQFLLVGKVSDSYTFTVETVSTPTPPTYTQLRSANFDVEVDTGTSTPTEFLDYNELYTYPVTSSYYRLLTQASSSGVEISVDYTNFEDFVHFSSATERLANFKYKLQLVQTYESASTAANLATTTAYYDNLITGVVSKFDGYEKYLYFESGAYAWPKSNSLPPYLNLDTTDTQAVTWYNIQLASASLYDELNESGLEYAIPEFIRQDPANEPYSLFLNMIGQHFDNVWIYAKAVTDKYDADNRLGYGVSKDLVSDVLKSFGVKLYNSNFSIANLSSLLLGEWYDSGSEQINSFVTASNSPTPDQDVLQETYKRIYHNLPYLIKTKGTERGLRALINCFGIPSGSLEISVFGGVNSFSTSPYFGSALPTGSKVRLGNTGSLVAGDTLSYYTSIQKENKKYTQDVNVVEVGFSPAYNINNFIEGVITGSFDIDQYIGDPRYLNESNYNSISNANLYSVAETLLSGSDAYNVFDFIRLIKFFDNQLFKMVRDFVPARDITTSGIIIKPHVLDRSKIKSPSVEWNRPEYSASIDTAFITASDGGSINTYSTAYTASVPGLLGTVFQIENTEVEKYNGELGGTVLDLYTGSLNTTNTYLQVNYPELRYNSTGSASNIFPVTGEYTWKYITAGPTANRTLFVDTIYLNKVTKDALDIDRALSRLNPGDTIKYQVSGSRTDGTFPPTTTQILKSFTGILAGKTRYNNPLGQPVWALRLERSNVVVTGFDSILETFNYGTIADVKMTIEPFLNEALNFYNSEYNATINNATGISSAANVQKVDYSDSILTPSNLSAIRSNTAEKAEVQEYLYNSAGSVRGRYTGQQLTGQNINIYSTGDVSYGTTPVLESTTPYFCIFDYISGFSPEHNRANAIVLAYIVDEEGNIITPDSSIALPIIQQGFPSDSKFELSIQSPSIGGSEAKLQGTQEVLRPAVRLEPILYSYTASQYLQPAYSPSLQLEFESLEDLTTYDMAAQNSGNQTPSTSFNATTVVTFATETKDDRSYYNTGTSIYTFGADTEQTVKFSTNINTLGTPVEDEFGFKTATVRYSIQASTDGTFSPTTTRTLATTDVDYEDVSLSQVISLNGGYFNFTNNTQVRVIVQPQDQNLDSLTLLSRTFQATSFESGSSFVSQADNGQNYFFTTASAATNTALTASISLSSKYENLFVGVANATTGQGFNTVTLPFTVQPGDEIKFNNEEDRTFLVTGVREPSENPEQLLYITLNAKPSTVINKDFFAIRRYVPTTGTILMKTDKVRGTQNAGILFPEYPSPRLLANYERIISELKNKGIL